jgi:hypothetical protein
VDAGDTLTYSALYDGGALPSWVTIDSSTGLITVTNAPSVTADEIHTITVIASDGSLASASDTFNLTIKDTTDPFLFNHSVADSSLHVVHGPSPANVTIINMPTTGIAALGNMLSFSLDPSTGYHFTLNDLNNPSVGVFGNAQYTPQFAVSSQTFTFKLDTGSDGIDATYSVIAGNLGGFIFNATGDGLFYGFGDNNRVDSVSGTHYIDLGGSNNFLNYSGYAGPAGVTVNFLNGTATATGLNDSFVHVQNVIGSSFNDTYYVNSSNGITENLGGGTDAVIASSSYALSANLENLTLTGIGNFNGTGIPLQISSLAIAATISLMAAQAQIP